MKITLNELRSLVKSIIKEEAENKKMNELFGFGKKKKEKELKEPTEEEILLLIRI